MAITATFGTAEYLDDDLIKIPITVDPAIVVLEVSDFKILDVMPIDSYIYGQGAGFGLYIIPKPETKGIMKVEAIGRVFASTAQSISDRQKVNSSIFAVAYNTITPTIIGKLVPSLILSGTQSVYLDLNIDVIGLNPQSFLVSGVDVGQPKLYAAPNPIIDLPDGSRPLPTEYVEYNNSDTPRRYFRLDFDFPDPPPLGNLNIDIKENSARGYLETYVSPSLPNMNLSFTLGLVFDQSYPITSSEIITGSITGLPDGISGSFSNNIIRINGTPTSTGSGNVSITITVDNISLTSTSPWTVVATAQQHSANTIPVLTMADSVLIKDKTFDVSGAISASPTKVYVEGLLRKWRYTYSSGVVHILGDAEDVIRIESGIWDIIIKYITGAILSSTDFNWESALIEDNLPANQNIFYITPENYAINFGSPSSGITYQNTGYNFIYRMPDRIYTSIRVQFTGTDTSNTGVYFRCRTASTPPTIILDSNFVIISSDITTHGTELFSAVQQVNNGVITPATADETITNPDLGLYIWIYFETTAYITRRLTLSGVGQSGSPGQETEIIENANWRVVESVPVITNPGTQTVFLNNEIRIPIAISYNPSVSMKGLLASMYYERRDTGADLLGSPNRVIASSENRMITVDASTGGGSDQELFKLIVVDENPPAMSNVVPVGGNTQATFSWSAVSGALSYAYRIGATDQWSDVGNKTSHTIENLSNGQLYTIYWRVNSFWIGDPVSVNVTPIGDLSQAMGVPGNMSIRFTWNAVDGAESYAYRIGSVGNWIDVGNVVEFTITGLTNGVEVTIYWRVNSPVLGQSISVRGTPIANVPAKVSGVSTNVSGSSIIASWNVPNDGGSVIVRYDLERDGTIINVGNTTSYTLSNLSIGIHRLRVRAFNSSGGGEWSDEVSATVSDPTMFDLHEDNTRVDGIGVDDDYIYVLSDVLGSFNQIAIFRYNTSNHQYVDMVSWTVTQDGNNEFLAVDNGSYFTTTYRLGSNNIINAFYLERKGSGSSSDRTTFLQSVSGTPINRSPSGIASDGTYVYVLFNGYSGATDILKRVRISDGQVSTYSWGNHPHAFASDLTYYNGSLYLYDPVVDNIDRLIAVNNSGAEQLSQNISFPEDTFPSVRYLNIYNDKIYFTGTQVSIVDIPTNAPATAWTQATYTFGNLTATEVSGGQSMLDYEAFIDLSDLVNNFVGFDVSEPTNINMPSGVHIVPGSQEITNDMLRVVLRTFGNPTTGASMSIGITAHGNNGSVVATFNLTWI